ncbi:hypothetical protein NBRC116590_07400 [Pelagimonas sp. KU-00592-HH]|uniref:hypothetical protein n=1 Tax=Pelagimonas sp. KU-00592-HH TaxID=3127651 RepID=UPI003106D56B
MESTMTASTNGSSWQIEPSNAIAGIILTVLFFYVFFRHFMFVLMIMDLVVGWLRKFRWFPKEGKRTKAFIHWVIAWALLVGYMIGAGAAGWLDFVPQ